MLPFQINTPVAETNTPSRGHGTYTAGTVNSAPLLKVGRKSVNFRPTFDHLMSPKCTKLHRFAPIFSKISRGNTPKPPKLGSPSQTSPLSDRPPSHFFTASAAAAR